MKSYHFDPTPFESNLIAFFDQLHQAKTSSPTLLAKLQKQFPAQGQGVFSKNQLIQAYRYLLNKGKVQPLSVSKLKLLRMKPVRTVSGVAPVTVLTKPFPCPGKCIFCPSDIRMPKSYLSDEPGAQRAERNWFDPYLQTYHRLVTLDTNGHSIDKIELIILGGTWSYYSEDYQIWFVKECFRALNDYGRVDGRAEILAKYQAMQKQLKTAHHFAPSNDPQSNKKMLTQECVAGDNLTETYNQKISRLYTAPEKKLGVDRWQTASWEELTEQQTRNEVSPSRCVGLVIETRPDNISELEVIRVRRLGCTKVQIGFQSLQDKVLELNKRGHDVAATRRAVKLLRSAGFKIHAHWMPNLFGSDPDADIADYQKMFTDPDFKPDELKIYPCSLIESAQLMQYFRNKKWRPYTEKELLKVLTSCFQQTPEYCRLTRVVRDIPSTNIVVGNKKTNFRQIVESKLSKLGKSSRDIRAREIRYLPFDARNIKFQQKRYKTSLGEEVFLEAVVMVKQSGDSKERELEKLLGFLRLSLPKQKVFIEEIAQAAMVREVHVYGRLTPIGDRQAEVQHRGIGKELISLAKQGAVAAGYKQLAVISAVGTREYYRKLGFRDTELYQLIDL